MQAEIIDFASRQRRPAPVASLRPPASRYVGRRVLHPCRGQGVVESERLADGYLLVRFDATPHVNVAAILPSLTFLDPPPPTAA